MQETAWPGDMCPPGVCVPGPGGWEGTLTCLSMFLGAGALVSCPGRSRAGASVPWLRLHPPQTRELMRGHAQAVCVPTSIQWALRPGPGTVWRGSQCSVSQEQVDYVGMMLQSKRKHRVQRSSGNTEHICAIWSLLHLIVTVNSSPQ